MTDENGVFVGQKYVPKLTQKMNKKEKNLHSNINGGFFMFRKNRMEKRLLDNLEQLNRTLTKNNILEIAELLGNKKQLFIRNLLTGITKGIGIGIGVTILTAILLIILQKIVTLNIPVIGDYISDIVEIVENRR